MNSLYRPKAVSVKVLLILALLLAPLSAVNLSARAAPQPQEQQPGSQDGNVVVLKTVQNPDGTSNVTVRIYAVPEDPKAPNTNFSLSQDTYIASGFPNNNYGAATNTAIGYSNTGPQAMRMLLQFNLSSIPSNATVNSATIYVYQYASTPSNDSPMGFQAQYAVSAWNQSTATWNTANFIGGAPLPVGNFPSTLGWLAIPSTNLFRTWVSGQQTNNGLIVTGDESPTNNRSRYFRSANASSNRPYVDINYTTSSCTYNTAPTSYVNSLPQYSPNAFTVSWTGTAYTPSGCPANGISSYVVWYQVNNGAFVKWLDGVSYTSAQFNASSLGIGNGALVGFRSQAIDYYGNKTPAGNATASTTIQSVQPTVVMTALPQWTTSSSFSVSWTGNTQGGAPITSYNFQVSTNGGASWTTLLANTPQTFFQYSGANGGSYQFRAQASNNGGGTFGAYSSPTGTTVDLTPPTVSMNSLPQYTSSTSFWVSWNGSDATSGVATYNVQYQLNGGAWQTLIQNTPQTSFYVQNAQTGQLWGFRVQAVDNAGNMSAWPGVAQASTTIFANPIAVVQPFNPAILQSTAPITKSFRVAWTGYTPPGSYITGYTVTFRINNGPWTLWMPFPGATTSADFNWFSMGLTGNGTYQFRAESSNSLGQAPYDVPSQYWQTIIVDMQGKFHVAAYLPIINYNSQ